MPRLPARHFRSISSRFRPDPEVKAIYSPPSWAGDYYGGSASALDGYNYGQATGAPSANSVVLIATAWYRRNITQGRIVVGTEENGDYVEATGHPLMGILKRPNPWQSPSDVLGGISDDLILWGNAYLLKAYDGFDDLRELHYVPNHEVEAVPEADQRLAADNGPIRSYVHSRGSARRTYSPSQVVHIRYRLDPFCPGMGASPLRGQDRNAAAITAAERYGVWVLINAHAGKIVAPTAGDVDWQEPEALATVRSIERGISGQNIGRLVKSPFPIDLIDAGLGPEQMTLDRITDLPIAKMLAALGLNATALDLPSSVNTATYANKGEAIRECYHSGLIPLQDRIDDALDAQVLAVDFTEPIRVGRKTVLADCVWHDRRNVEALREDASEKAARTQALATIATGNELRAMVDLKPLPDGNESPFAMAAQQQQAAADAMANPDPAIPEMEPGDPSDDDDPLAGKSLEREDDDPPFSCELKARSAARVATPKTKRKAGPKGAGTRRRASAKQPVDRDGDGLVHDGRSNEGPAPGGAARGKVARESPERGSTAASKRARHKEEVETLQAYADGNNRAINATLRGKPGEGFHVGDKSVHHEIAVLDRALARRTLKKDATLYRGLDRAKVFGNIDPKELVGRTIPTSGFTSTSRSYDVADRPDFNRGVLMKIKAPKGTPGASLTTNKGEREVILPRGTKLKITKVSKGGTNQHGIETTIVHAEVVRD